MKVFLYRQRRNILVEIQHPGTLALALLKSLAVNAIVKENVNQAGAKAIHVEQLSEEVYEVIL